MKQNSIQQPRQELSFFQSIKKGALIALIIGILIYFLQLLYPVTPWKSLGGPPSGAIRIVEAGENESAIWVEANDGKIYRHVDECFYGIPEETCLIGWLEVDNYAYNPSNHLVVERGNDCRSLRKGFFPLNPQGETVECTNTYHAFFDPYNDGIYFALSTEGTLHYCYDLGLSTPNEDVIVIIVILLFVQVIVAIIVSVIFGIKTLLRKRMAF